VIIQLNTDANISGTEELASQVAAAVNGSLGHLSQHITRVEVHLSDTNSGEKTGPSDKRCLMEARPAGHQPVVASDAAPTVAQAVDGAADKLRRSLEKLLGRLAGR